jgi:hypothetical protein
VERPTIEYPCAWQFRVLGEDERQLRQVVADIFSDRLHQVTTGNTSSGGKYCSIEVATQVSSEADRDAKFRLVGSAMGVRMVL